MTCPVQCTFNIRFYFVTVRFTASALIKVLFNSLVVYNYLPMHSKVDNGNGQ